ncbi:MAG: glycerophosphodiester phosphodiesterase [Spirochaetales bacterium]|nr:glycerophosphodiester phosphodiesterase [Spirochaetales bacterium]
MLLFGHRGYSGIAPENTLAAFRALLEHGVPGVELDVHLSRDGGLPVVHDDNLRRVTGRDVEVEECTIDEIRELDAGAWFGDSFRGERVPVLEEVFELLGSRVYYDIELKWGRRAGGGLEERVLECIRDHGLRGRCLISSFNPFCIRRVQALDPAQPTAHIYANHPEVPRLLRRGQARWVVSTPVLKPRHDQIGPWTALLYRRLLPSRILAWTVDEPAEARRLLALGVQGIISNQPGRIAGVFRDFSGIFRDFAEGPGS